MTDTHVAHRAVSADTIFANNRGSAIFGASNCLRFAAAPTFAIMALLGGIRGGSMPDMLCSTTQDGSWLTGMVPMYVLMSLFHAPPWFELIIGRSKKIWPE